MRNILLACFAGFFFLIFPLKAQELQPQVEHMMNRLSKAQSVMKNSDACPQELACRETQPPVCVFENYCSDLSRKSQEFYLYQDADGYRIPNSAMLELATLAKQCGQKPFPQAQVNDPFAYPEKFMNEESAGGKSALANHQASLQKAQKRAEKVFDETRTLLLAYLKKIRTAANASQIDNMIARTQTVKITYPQMKGSLRDLVSAGCDSPNAWYSASDHSVIMCPQFLNYPESALLWTLAHELSHAFDPCHLAMAFSKQGAIFPEWMDDFTRSQKKEFPAVASAKNPFSKVISCLQSAKSTGMAIPSKDVLIREADQELQEFKKEAKELGIQDLDSIIAENKERKKLIREQYNEFKACPQLTGRGHICESFADWIAAEILAAKIQTIPEAAKAREYAFSSQAVFWGTSCKNVRQSLLNNFKSAKKCLSAEDLGRFLSASEESLHHLSPSRRINRILFAKPEIKKALGCLGGEDVQHCP